MTRGRGQLGNDGRPQLPLGTGTRDSVSSVRDHVRCEGQEAAPARTARPGSATGGPRRFPPWGRPSPCAASCDPPPSTGTHTRVIPVEDFEHGHGEDDL
jgi:hypothetical protein